MTAQVRDATPEDAQAMAVVQIEAWRAAYHSVMPAAYLGGLDVGEFTDRWTRTLSVESGTEVRHLVGEVDGRVVAVAAIGAFRARGDDRDPTGELWMLNVHPDAFGTGVATTVHAAAIGWLAERHAAAVLWVVRENSRARRFYEREGWWPDGHETIADLGGAEVTELRYARALPGR